MPTQTFPFSAVIGQEHVKIALQLIFLDPKLGGLVISGGKGNGKSTIARGFGELLHELGEQSTPFVSLPLGTSEEKLLGSIDLERMLEDKSVAFTPGIINRAHGGMMYVDEVNLLPDHLVDQLLDVAATGVHRVERDHISHESVSNFALVGSMNPDEGELRPQLLDRFGLWVDIEEISDPALRREIVQNRIQFDAQPGAYIESQQTRTQSLIAALGQAQERLPKVTIDEARQDEIAQLCIDAGAQGLRADLFMRRAAIAYAALLGDEAVESRHIESVAPWVLKHRRTKETPNHTDSSSTSPGTTPSQSSLSADSNTETQEGQWGKIESAMDLPTRFDRSYDAEGLLQSEQQTKPLQKKTDSDANGYVRKRGTRSHAQRQGSATISQTRIDLVATVTDPENLHEDKLKKLVFFNKAASDQTHYVVLADTSGSCLKKGVMNKTLGLIHHISEHAYRSRSGLSLISFSGQGVVQEKDFSRAPKLLTQALSQLHGGGGTPLTQALEYTEHWLKKQRTRPNAVDHYKLLLITDGRTKSQLAPLTLDTPICVLDVEHASVPLQGAKRIAQQLGADYILADQISAGASQLG